MSKIITHQDLKSYFGDEDHLVVSQNSKFSDMIFELLSDKKPTESQSKIFELILNLLIDHGSETPSAIKVIEAAKDRQTISESLAAGVLEINDTHGGAMEPLMKELYRIQDGQVNISDLVKNYLTEGKKLPGFGHRIYKETDPRADLILNKLQSVENGERFFEIIKELQLELANQSGKQLVINIDGAIAASLCTFGWEPRLGKAVFLSARVPGLCAHFLNNS